MGGLIALIILVPLIFFILLLVILNRLSEQRRLTEALYDEIKSLKDKAPIHKESPAPVTQPIIQEVKKEPEVPVAPVKPPEVVIKREIQPQVPLHEITPRQVAITQTEPQVATTHQKIEEPEKTGTDIEKFIGENLANKIGIAVLVLGIAFFVKYAIDKNWINEAGRVIIGLICGGILVGLAHYFRNTYRSFSSVLVGGGLSVFYFSVAFAFHQYGLISQSTAFICMVIISGFGVVLSLYYKRQELAILATIGAFITPFLVSTGKENYIALFTYLCIINAGLMVLSWFKKWPAINIIALFFTTFIYGGWLIKRTVIDDPATLPQNDALLFASLFYLLFVAMNILNSVRLREKFTAFDAVILLSTNFLFFTAGMVILGYGIDSNQGIFTGGIGLFNLLLAFIFYRKKSIDRNFASLFIGMAISFISLVAPVELKGNHIVLFWATEAVVLIWLYQRSRIALLGYFSLIVLIGMLVSILNNWTISYFQGSITMPIVMNKGFITNLVAAVALFIYYALLRKEQGEYFLRDIAVTALRRTVLVTAVILAWVTGLMEIWYQFDLRYYQPVAAIYLQLYTFAVTLIILKLFRKDRQYPLLKFLLTAICFAFYLYNIGNNSEVSFALVQEGKAGLFMAHWIATVLLLWLLSELVVFFFSAANKSWEDYAGTFTWIAASGIIFVLSNELYHVMLWNNYNDGNNWAWWENLYYKAGLTILWGLCSFAMMWLGMKKNFRPLRIISLTLFTVTIIKLFTFDIRNIPPGGKIAAFILLGVLLLAVSFMYQRLKKIIIDNTTV